MWSNVISPCSSVFTPDEPGSDKGCLERADPPPPTRYKHGTTLHYDSNDGTYYLYVYGGRSGTFALKDFWQLNLTTGLWREIRPPKNENGSDNWPPRLQEHTLVSGGNNKLYVFGGECYHNSDSSSHVWVWGRGDKGGGTGWERIPFKNEADKGVRGPSSAAPVMRRGHSAVVADLDGEGGACMVIYGGYRDLKGSLCDTWAFNFGSENWTALSVPSQSKPLSKPSSFWTNILNYWTISSSSSSTSPSSSSYTNLIHSNGYYSKSPEWCGPLPPARHNHSAVVCGSKMYVYGGMCDLVELSDFWVLDLETRRWSQIKCLYSPGVLKGHAASVVGTHMYVFGGEGKGGVRSDDVWRFEFNSETFERLTFPGCRPCARVFSTATKLPLRTRASSADPNHPSSASTPTDGLGSSKPSTSTSFRKSTSVVRFADTQHLVTYSDSPSDYSSMETINYVENPNYRHHRASAPPIESFEMRQMGQGPPPSQQQQLQQAPPPQRLQILTMHPEYVLLIGGLETHKSAVFSKQDLVVWRLRVDCACDRGANGNGGGLVQNRITPERHHEISHRFDAGRSERNFEVEF